MPRNPCVYISPVVISSLSWKPNLLIPSPDCLHLNWNCSSKTAPQVNIGPSNTEWYFSTCVLLCLGLLYLLQTQRRVLHHVLCSYTVWLNSSSWLCIQSLPWLQPANCFQINLSPCLVFSAPLRNSPCFVPLLSLPLLPAVHSPWTLPNSLQVMVVSPVPTPPSKHQASLRLEIAKKKEKKNQKNK